jgi:hypothetical protein
MAAAAAAVVYLSFLEEAAEGVAENFIFLNFDIP